jgi:imidazole glycerol phosphate synthase subunit HisF
MIQVNKFLTEVGHFIKELDTKSQVVNLISGWDISEDSSKAHPFLTSDSVAINSDAVTLADVVEANIKKIKTGQDVVVILADNRQHTTKMEYFKCNIPEDSTLTATQIVGQSQVNFYEGKNYYDAEIL